MKIAVEYNTPFIFIPTNRLSSACHRIYQICEPIQSQRQPSETRVIDPRNSEWKNLSFPAWQPSPKLEGVLNYLCKRLGKRKWNETLESRASILLHLWHWAQSAEPFKSNLSRELHYPQGQKGLWLSPGQNSSHKFNLNGADLVSSFITISSIKSE